MVICYDAMQLERFVREAFAASEGQPVLIDRFLEDATEVDVDAIADGERVIVAGVMEHIEEAGVHSGDSACAIPPYSLPGPVVTEIREATTALARELRVRGLMNVQFAVKKEKGRPVVYVLEVNPRASRTVPFVSKATGMPLAKVATKIMAGISLAQQGYTRDPIPSHVSVKEAVFPFVKFAGVDIVLGPEMKSTGEVMGVSERFSIAFAKSQLAAGTVLPANGRIFISLADREKHCVVDLARRLEKLGFELLATRGTAQRMEDAGIKVQRVKKDSGRPPQPPRFHAGRPPATGSEYTQRQGSADRRRADPGSGRLHGHPLYYDDPGGRGCRPRHGGNAQEEMTVQAVQDRFPCYGKNSHPATENRP